MKLRLAGGFLDYSIYELNDEHKKVDKLLQI